MNKIKLGIIFGGMSTEHNVSITSATSVIKNLNKDLYEIYPIYIDKSGMWCLYEKNIDEIDTLEIGEEPKEVTVINREVDFLKKMDCIFPVLHGLYGEDGTIQGMLELLQIPYVGCGIVASSVCMDKVYAKILLNNANIAQADFIYLKEIENGYCYFDEEFNEIRSDINQIVEKIEEKFEYPVFIKPSNSGSSFGVNKAINREELISDIKYAFEFDKKVLVEEAIVGKEVECAVLGNDNVIASTVGEIISADEFYDYSSKYENNSSKTNIPASLSKEKIEEIRNLAIKAYKVVDGSGLSRVDFFVENKTNKVILNEINTMPGFTKISMYPKLFEASGIRYSDLLDKLIEMAIKKEVKF